MSSAPARTYKFVIVAMVAVIVVLIGIIAQLQRTPSTTAEPADPGGSEPAAVVSDAPASAKTDEQVKLEQFLVDEFPRRQEGDPLALGEVDAPVVLTEWADYRCPFCSVWAEETLPGLHPLIDDGTLRVEFRDLAIFGDESIRAATAARAAGVQGHYFEFAHELFVALPNEGHPDIPDELVFGIVEQLGLDLEQFKTDWADPAHQEAVLADSQEAQSMGISSTPSFVIGSQFVAGALPIEEFQEIIRQQAGLAG